MARWHRFLRKRREAGLVYAAQLIFDRVVPASVFQVSVTILFALDLRHRSGTPDDSQGVRWATSGDLARAGWAREPSIVRQRFERGSRAAILEEDGHLIGQVWFDCGVREEYDWLRFTLSPHDVWRSDSSVDVARRRQGVFSRLVSFSASDYAQAGYRRILCRADVLNRNSIRAQHKTGSTPVCRMLIVRIFGLTLIRAGRWRRVGWWSARHRLDVPVHLVDGSSGA